MKLRALLLFLLVTACSSNAVCIEIMAVDKDAKCVPVASGLGSDKSTDIAILRYGTGGARWCKSTLDPAKPIDCGEKPMVPSQEEQQAAQLKEQARREAEAAHTPVAPPAPVVDGGIADASSTK